MVKFIVYMLLEPINFIGYQLVKLSLSGCDVTSIELKELLKDAFSVRRI